MGCQGEISTQALTTLCIVQVSQVEKEWRKIFATDSREEKYTRYYTQRTERYVGVKYLWILLPDGGLS